MATTTDAIRINGPVGDGGDNNIVDVIRIEMRLNDFIEEKAIKGVTDTLFTGWMTDEFIHVIRKFQQHVVGLPRPDGRIDPNGKTLKYINGSTSMRGGKAPATPVKPPATVAAARKKIAETAGKYQREGGHFLMGARGDMPGLANGHPLRPAYTMPASFMDNTHPHDIGPAINAAWVKTSRFGILGCMGRPARKKIPNNGKLLPGNPRLKLLDNYVECIRTMRSVLIPPTRWPGFEFYELSPKKFDAATTPDEFLKLLGSGVTGIQFPRRTSPHGQLHLGESCIGRRHYDCIGFVNFVLSKVLSANWATDMSFYRKSNSKFDVKEFKESEKSDVIALAQDGDIVLKSAAEKHCGICRTVNGTMAVANSRSMATGLINSPLTAEWTFLARLKSV